MGPGEPEECAIADFIFEIEEIEMIDKRDIVRQIEDRLGGEGAYQMADDMFDELMHNGGLMFDAATGFEFVIDDESVPNSETHFQRALCAVIANEVSK
jgi:hypothetical protein